MTLCIAANCLDGDEPKIVMCTDWREEYPWIGSHENADKLDFVKDGWPVLLSGEGPSEKALVSVYQQALKNVEFRQENIFEKLKAPIETRKSQMANDYTTQTLAMSHEDFLKEGRSRLPKSLFTRHANAIETIRLGASLIICGFIDAYDFVDRKMEPTAVIATVDDAADSPEKVFSIHQDFAAIGSGYSSALGVLCRRGQSSDDSLLQTIYVVYEAKALSETVPGVSRSLAIDVLSSDGTMQSLSDEGYKVCAKLYSRFGPRPIKQETEKQQMMFKMESRYLEPFMQSFRNGTAKRKAISSSGPSDSSTGNEQPS